MKKEEEIKILKAPKEIKKILWKIIDEIRDPDGFREIDADIYGRTINTNSNGMKNVDEYANMYHIGTSTINWCEFAFNVRNSIPAITTDEDRDALGKYIFKEINRYMKDNPMYKENTSKYLKDDRVLISYLCGEVFLMTDDNDKLFMFFISTDREDTELNKNIFFPIISSCKIGFDIPERTSLWGCLNKIRYGIGYETTKRLEKEYESNKNKHYIQKKQHKIDELLKEVQEHKDKI